MLRSPECEMCACQAGVFLGEYTGMVQRRDNTKTFEQGGQYLATVSVPLACGGTLELDIDAEEAGNEMRCMNDYHMMASEPNVEFRGMRHFSGEPGMGVFTLRRVSAGSELLVNYGADYWNRYEEEALRFPVFVQVKGCQARQVNVHPTTTVNELKIEMLGELHDAGSPEQYYLRFKGVPLLDGNQPISDTGLQEKSKVDLIKRSSGIAGPSRSSSH